MLPAVLAAIAVSGVATAAVFILLLLYEQFESRVLILVVCGQSLYLPHGGDVGGGPTALSQSRSKKKRSEPVRFSSRSRQSTTAGPATNYLIQAW